MSDDLNNLRPTGDEDDSEDLPDWQADQPKKSGGSGSGDSLGFTGELSWRKDVDDAFDEQLGADDDTPDWQQDQPAAGSAPSSGSFGFTGELDWKKTQPGAGDEPESPSEQMDWLKDDLFDEPLQTPEPTQPEIVEDDPFALPPQDDASNVDDLFAGLGGADEEDPFALPPEYEPPAARVEPDDDDPLSWLQQFSATESQPEARAPEPVSEVEVPSWLDEAEPETPIEEALPDDAPPWLQEIDQSEKPMSEGGKLSDDWLSGAEHAPDTAAPGMTFEQWQRIQDEVTRPRDVDEEMPDLFSELGGDVTPGDLPASDTGELPSWVLGMNELDTNEAPDWFTGNESPAPETPSVAPTDDIFGELGLPSPDTGYDFLDQPAEDDLLAGLDLGVAASDSPDWFSETVEPAAVKNTPDWLDELGDLSNAGAPPESPNLAAELQDDDFFNDLPDFTGGDSQPDEINPLHTPGLQDIDSLLASYIVEQQLPSTGELVTGGADLDQIFSQQEIDEIGVRRSGESRPGEISGLSPDAPDWLTELGANVDEVSAAAIVRKQTQREKPLEDLSDRLQALHDLGLELPTSEESVSSDVLKSVLPGVNEVLPSTPIRTVQGDRTGDLILSDAQRQKIVLLRTLVGTEEAERRPTRRPSAIDLTLTTPNLSDLGILDEPDLGLGDQTQPEPEPAPAAYVPRKRLGIKIDRLLVALLLTAAVVLPFVVSPLRIGDLPPAQFAAGSPQAGAFNRVDSLSDNDLVLVAAEYGPTGAGELDMTLDALLRHMLLRGARPVIVSGNAVGLLHARNILDNITADQTFLNAADRPQIQAGSDYYVLRYLPANTIGLRAFSEDIPQLLSVDANGQPTNLGAQGLRDFGLIVLVAENAEDVRGWAEQVAPLAGKPLLVATGQSAAPLAEPYVSASGLDSLSIGGIAGMLVGYRDAYTYQKMLESQLFPSSESFELPTETPILPPTQTLIPTAETTVESGLGVQVEVSPTIEATITSEAQASPTPENARPTNTVPPTTTDEPNATPTVTPTNTLTSPPTATDAPTSTPGLIVRAVIDSAQAVNVREGPGRTFPPIGSVTPGTIVQVIGRSGDGTWIQVRLNDGREGWVSADLLAIEEPDAPLADTSPTPESSARNIDQFAMVSLISDVYFFPPAQAQEITPEVTDEATSSAIAETTVEPIISGGNTASALPNVGAYREERWYGMTLGLVAIILIITIGMIVNILRGPFRRRSS